MTTTMIKINCYMLGIIAATTLFIPKVEAKEAAPSKLDTAKWESVLEKENLDQSQLEELSKFVSSHTNDPAGHRLLARAYGKLGMPDFACHEVEQAWRLDLNSLEDLVSALRYYHANKENDKFNGLLDEALQQYTGKEMPLSMLGQLLLRNGDNTNALKFFHAALKINPSNVLTQVLLIKTLLNLGEYQDVLLMTQPLIANPSTASPGLYLRGKALLGMHRDREACSTLAQAYKLEHNNIPELTEAYFNALIRCGKYKEALEPGLVMLYQLSRQGQDMTTTKNSLLLTMKNLPWNYVETAINLASQSDRRGYFCFALGDLLDRLGKPNAAIQEYYKGLTLNPNYGRAYMRLGQDMERNVNNWGEALQLYSRAYSCDPQDRQIEARHNRFFSRFPNKDKDIALRIKSLVNSCRRS